jgi:hypothetical protein
MVICSVRGWVAFMSAIGYGPINTRSPAWLLVNGTVHSFLIIRVGRRNKPSGWVQFLFYIRYVIVSSRLSARPKTSHASVRRLLLGNVAETRNLLRIPIPVLPRRSAIFVMYVPHTPPLHSASYSKANRTVCVYAARY